MCIHKEKCSFIGPIDNYFLSIINDMERLITIYLYIYFRMYTYNTFSDCGAKMIFTQFDTIILSVMCHFIRNEIS